MQIANTQDKNKIAVPRVKGPVKLVVIVLSILALSLFFEGWRQVKTGLNLEHCAVLAAGILSTVFLLWVQAFWIYLEEKGKGSLKKKIVHFDRLQELLEKKEDRAIKGLKDIVILILAAITLIVALIFLPWSELGFNGNFPDWLADLMKHLGILDFAKTNFNALANHQQLMKVVKADHATDNIGDYAYSLFLFVAISAASIGIILIGKEENSEKTVLQAKK